MKALVSLLPVLVACGGESEPPILTRSDDAAPGAECEYGGQRVEQGADDNESGTLEPEEIDDVSFICHGPRIHEGDFIVTDDYQAQQLRDINVITGSLLVDAPTVTTLIEAKVLVRVDGNVTHNTARLSMRFLKHVGGTMILKPYGNGTDHVLSALESIGGGFTVCGGYDVSGLAAVGGDLVIECGSFGVSMPKFSALADLGGGISIKRLIPGDFIAPLVTRVDFVTADPGLVIENGIIPIERFSMPALTTIDGQMNISFTRVSTLELPALQTVGSLKLVGNSMLCNSIALELATRTGAPSEISQNASCFR